MAVVNLASGSTVSTTVSPKLFGNTVTSTMSPSGVLTWNAAQSTWTIQASPSSGLAPRNRSQLSPACRRAALGWHKKCCGVLDGLSLAEDGIWCACICHPDPVPKDGDFDSTKWLIAFAKWSAARKLIDQMIGKTPPKSKMRLRAAERAALRRTRESNG